jgi:CheY-like chemotaxis protein
VVDDTPHNVKLLADLLGVKGYSVTTAVNGEEALAKVAADPPDYRFARRDDAGLVLGYGRLTRRLRCRSPDRPPPRRARPSLDPQAEARQGDGSGGRRLLSKPITRRSSSRAFARCCGSSRCRTKFDSSGRACGVEQKLEERVAAQASPK